MRRGSRQFFGRKKREVKNIKFKCPHCGQRISGARELVGKSGKCPRCLAKFVLEAPLLISPPLPKDDKSPLAKDDKSPLAKDDKRPPPKKRNPLVVPLICTSAAFGLTLITAVVYFFHFHSPAGSAISASGSSATPTPLPAVQAAPVPADLPPPEPKPKIAASALETPAAATPLPVPVAVDAGPIALARTPLPPQPPKPANPRMAPSGPAKPALATPPSQQPAPARAAVDAGVIILAQTPPAVQRTVLANIGNGKVTSISKVLEEGEVSYEVDFTKDGQLRDLRVGENGRLFSIQRGLAETPPAVQKSIRTQLGGDTLDTIEKMIGSDETTYVVNITTRDGRNHQFTIAEDGEILEEEIALSEAPAPVQRTVTAQMGSGILMTLTKTFGDKVTYEAEFTRDGKDGAVTVAANGALLSVKITLAETTGPAQTTILEKVGNGRILSVWKSLEKRENVFPFKVESMKDGKPFNFSVGPNGRFLGIDD